MRADTVRRDDEVEVAGASARKRRCDPIAPLRDVRDMITEDILGVFAGPIIKDLGEIAAQDLQLGRGTGDQDGSACHGYRRRGPAQ